MVVAGLNLILIVVGPGTWLTFRPFFAVAGGVRNEIAVVIMHRCFDVPICRQLSKGDI